MDNLQAEPLAWNPPDKGWVDGSGDETEDAKLEEDTGAARKYGLFKDLIHRHRGVMDGGFATYLEDICGIEMASPFWSARIIMDSYHRDFDTAPVSAQPALQNQADAHYLVGQAFLTAGARMIQTATYQASAETYLKSQGPSQGSSKVTAKPFQEAMRRSVRKTHRLLTSKHQAEQSSKHAIDEGVIAAPLSRPALMTLSLGPYGAMLEEGREYTGDYSLAGAAQNETVQRFHFDRLSTIADSSADFKSPSPWRQIDVIAFETIPRLDEVRAISRALTELDAKLKQSGEAWRPAVYFTFVFPEDAQSGGEELLLPCPPDLAGTGTKDRTIRELVATVRDVCASGWPVLGLGANCTKPHLMPRVIKQFAAALRAETPERGRFATGSGRPVGFFYPDGGLTWDGKARQWLDANGTPQRPDAAKDQGDQHSKAQEAAWAQTLYNATQQDGVLDTEEVKGAFEATWLGGCCKATTDHIAALARLVYKE